MQSGSRASLPDWARLAVAADNPPWVHEGGGLVLLDSTQVRFVPREASKASAVGAGLEECRVQVLWRGAARLTGSPERSIEYASLPYNPGFTRVISASAWVVSPDGRKTESFEKRDFVDSVAVYNTFFWDNRRVLRFPSEERVGAGGVLAWEFRFEMDDVFREYGKPFLPSLPMLRAEFEAIPAPGTRLEFEAGHPRLRSPKPGGEPGSLRWEVSRELPLPEHRPTGFFANPMAVFVRCMPSSQGPTDYTWSVVSQKAASILEPRIEPNAMDIRGQAMSLVEGKTGRWERVRALSEFVQGSIAYLEITIDQDALAGMRPHHPSDVLRNRYGDCKDKAVLLASMLRAVGDDSRVALVSSGNPLAVVETWPANSFNHVIVLIRADGSESPSWPVVDGGEGARWVLFDPTNSFTPLGVLPDGDAGGFGLIVSPQGGRLFRVPFSDPATSRSLRKIEAVMDSRGGLRASIVEDTFGKMAAAQYGGRYNKSHEQYQDLINARVHRANPLCKDLNWTDHWSPADAHYRLTIGFSVASYGRAMPGGLMLVSPDVLPGTAKFEPWSVENDGVSVLGPDEVEEEVRLSIPEGYSVEELPDGWKTDQALLSAEITYRVDGSSVVLTKHLSRKAGFFKKGDYEALRNLYRQVHEAERRSVILRRQPVKT
jgi:hypothetical protein